METARTQILIKVIRLGGIFSKSREATIWWHASIGRKIKFHQGTEVSDA